MNTFSFCSSCQICSFHALFSNPLKRCFSAHIWTYKTPAVFRWHVAMLYYVLSLPCDKVRLTILNIEDTPFLTYHSYPFFCWRTSPWKPTAIIAGVCTASFHAHHEYWTQVWECCKVACDVALSVSSIKSKKTFNIWLIVFNSMH